MRYLPASVFSPKAPAGEMWSVVMESPSLARTLALLMLLISGSSSISSKNGGLRMYVESGSHLNSGESSQGTASHLADPLKMSLYFDTYTARVTNCSVSSWISQSEGQMSLR